jgi:ribosome assembly protein YihI (activator of Der GTPase)
MRKMVSMARSAEEKARSMMPPSMGDMPDFPYGLAISLNEDDLEKLDLDADCEVGDMIDLRAFGRVTSVSKTEVDGKSRCRVEIQIEQLGIEDEDQEDEDEPEPRHMDRRKRYGT